ncbi:MAG: S26 family signal peptidase [Deltaproteobacteria bacterium]|uniref:S26 family signal peptidase n=1 Tax=Desulfobacula sp. TaxID=2593537 RepID=UPI00199E3583|nr:S26 family signal peptidase [Candidatus Desulfobacula maris]MBL6995187.1 S26 family signal peptidase [Desulfobacula sp.]
MKKNDGNKKSISTQTAHILLKNLSRGGSLIKFSGTIQGNSMLPWIKDADTIKIVPITSKIKVGDIVACYEESNSRFVAHRIIKTANNNIITKGDNCFAPDPDIKKEDLAGKVAEIYRKSVPVTFGLGTERYLIAILSRMNILQLLTRIVRKMKFIFS